MHGRGGRVPVGKLLEVAPMNVRSLALSLVGGLALLALGTGLGVAQHEERGQPAAGKPAEGKPAEADKAAKIELPKCPVSGEPVDFYVSTVTDDGPVYFCCPDCIAKFKAKPAEFAVQVKAQRAAASKLPRVQVTCPVSGEPISKKSFLERDGQKIYFCCNDCKGKYEADPAAYKAKLAASYTYQAKCPVMGGDIDPTAFTDLPTKQRVYFCCMACEKKLLADPDEYVPKLAAQGLKVDAAKLKKALAETKSGEKPEKAEKAEKGEKKGEKP